MVLSMEGDINTLLAGGDLDGDLNQAALLHTCNKCMLSCYFGYCEACSFLSLNTFARNCEQSFSGFFLEDVDRPNS